jgi:hypothetical protein
VEISIDRLKRELPEARFLIVCPSAGDFSHLNDGRTSIAEDSEYAVVSKAELRQRLAPSKHRLVGWYYQQFLKFGILAATQEKRALVLDADTVLLRNIRSDANTFFTSKERHEVYFKHFKLLFKADAPFQASAITNFMWFDTDAVREMLLDISGCNSQAWWTAITDTANELAGEGTFSEYETYANWYSLRHGPHVEFPINIFRRGDLLVTSSNDYHHVVADVEAQGYDAVTFELNHHGGRLRRLVARLLLRFSIKRW